MINFEVILMILDCDLSMRSKTSFFFQRMLHMLIANIIMIEITIFCLSIDSDIETSPMISGGKNIMSVLSKMEMFVIKLYGKNDKIIKIGMK